MRELKFRYWNGVNNIMVYEPKIRKDYQFSLNEYINKDRGWVWMQFTGLKDKHGKEIYEGDIVRGKAVGKHSVECNYVVEKVMENDADEGGYCGYYTGYVLPNRAETLEVIGNIYQDKELNKQ